jgi:predicted RNA binding protein YcfA (HicA-like mRNA interferase family)
MPTIPVLSAQEIVVFQSVGWTVARAGNHIVLVKRGHSASLSVPNHREVARGTLRTLIRISGLTLDQFLESL